MGIYPVMRDALKKDVLKVPSIRNGFIMSPLKNVICTKDVIAVGTLVKKSD